MTDGMIDWSSGARVVFQPGKWQPGLDVPDWIEFEDIELGPGLAELTDDVAAWPV
jgi:hypothetical protein